MKLNDAECQLFIELQLKIKELSKQLDSLKDRCKEVGTFYTKNYACVVLPQSQERLAGLDDVCRVIRRDILESHGLVRKNEFLIVKVAPINRIKAG